MNLFTYCFIGVIICVIFINASAPTLCSGEKQPYPFKTIKSIVHPLVEVKPQSKILYQVNAFARA